MTPRTCALCGERDATTVTDLDGRPVPACARCLAPVPDPEHPYEPIKADLPPFEPSRDTCGSHDTRAAILAAVDRLGAGCTTGQIAAVLGIRQPGWKADRSVRRPYDALSQSLVRLVADGYLAAEYIDAASPRKGKTYRIGARVPVLDEFRHRWGLDQRRIAC